MAKTPKKRGPEAARLKIPGRWETAVEKALAKKKPPDGWPMPAPRAMVKRLRKQRGLLLP